MTGEDYAILLDKAAEICVTRHAGQRDKAGTAYFMHPMRVAMRCSTDEERIVAMLHDTVEDTDVTPEYLLEQGFPQVIVDGIMSVTKRAGETYEDFVSRAGQNPIGRKVKIHDLEDNLDALRLNEFDERMAQRFTKYLAAYRFLTDESPAAAKPLTKAEYFRNRRAEINKHILQQMKSKSGSIYNQETLMVTMADGNVLCSDAAIDTFIAVLGRFGFDKVASVGKLHNGRYPLVARENLSRKYKEATSGWYVLSDCYNKFKAIYINELADILNEPVIAEMTAK